MRSGPDLALAFRISLDDLTGNLEVFRTFRCMRITGAASISPPVARLAEAGPPAGRHLLIFKVLPQILQRAV
jgi:hypothetical protein